jgi:branched-chain amino acid transport system permease protein
MAGVLEGTAVAGPVAGRRFPTILVLEIVLLTAALVLPLFLDHFWVVLATRTLILCLVALSFDLLWGYTGIMSFGQALFYGASAYSAALFARDLGITSIFVIAPLCTLIGLVLALMMAWFLPARALPAEHDLRRARHADRVPYAADRLARGWYYLGGQNGIPSIPPLTAAATRSSKGPGYYYLALGILVALYQLCRWLVRSQFGLVLAGFRQHEERLTFLGYRVQHFKAIIFTFAGGMCGLAGALAAFHDGFVWPNMLGVLLSTQIVLYVLFGGVGTLVGRIVGVASIDYMSFVLADRFPAFWPILLGLLLLFVVLVRPTGLCGLVRLGAGARRALRPPPGGDACPGAERLMALLEVAGSPSDSVSSRPWPAWISPWRRGKSTGSSGPMDPARAR